MYREVNLDRDSDTENSGRENVNRQQKKRVRSATGVEDSLTHVDEHLRLKIIGGRFCPKGFQSLFYFTCTEKGRSRNDAYPALLTFSRFHVIALNFDAQVAELFESGLACRRGNIIGKDRHCLEGEIFGFRGNERFDGFSIAQSKVRAGFVEEDRNVVFR